MAIYSKGGRGKKAPYKTVHYRIPEPIKPIVEDIADKFREASTTDSGFDEQEFLSSIRTSLGSSNSMTDLNQAEIVSILREALKIKANAGDAIKERIKEALRLIEK